MSFLEAAKNYGYRLSDWAVGRVSRYGVAFGLMAGSALLFTVSFGVATAAAFHFLEQRYDVWTAYAVVGGAFLAGALILFFAGLTMVRRDGPRAPRPPPARVLLRQMASCAVSGGLSSCRNDLSSDRTSLILAGGAAALLLGWVVVSKRSG